MDEKWFYTVVTRTNCKVLTSIGLDPVDYYAHHKNYIGKEMYIVVTAFVLNDNDICKGGKAIPIACVRVGRMKKAARDSYKRVYKEDGSYTYPKNAEGLLRRKGEEYFAGVELTGSKEGTEKDPKMSLLKVYQDTIVPALEEKVVGRLNEGGERQVVIVKQEDGAGLHQDGTYVSTMKKVFAEKEWLLFNQPSQSPVTNVHDACIFPMMSKAVSSNQAMVYGSQLLKGEELNKTVMQVFDDKAHLPTIARVFTWHSQIVCSILEHDGDNDYLSKRGGVHFWGATGVHDG